MLARTMLIASASIGVSSFPVTVISKIGANELCNTNMLTLFVGYDNMNVADHGSKTFDYRDDAWNGFGVQENGWYWRGPAAKASEQNPDNAGMQVKLEKGTCKATTSLSIAGGAVPDAQRLFRVESSPGQNGGCTVEVYRKATTDLCVAGHGSKQCCAPCSVFGKFDHNCCTHAADGGQETCFHKPTLGPAPPTPAPKPAQCEVRVGVDVQVTAYLKVPATSPDECCTACSADSRCKVAVFHVDHCSLKDSVRLVDSSSQFVAVFPHGTLWSQVAV